jgi:tetratricopeptide (TPR) repeat protein
LAADREVRFQLRIARAQLLVELGRAAEAVEACRESLVDAEQPRERVEALLGMAAGMRLNDRIADGLSTLAEAQPLADASGLTLQRSRLHHLRGNLLFPLGRHAECLREHESARLLAREAGSFESEVAAVGGLGDAFYLQGRMRSAYEKFRECVRLARQHDFGRLEVANLPMLGWSSQHLNDVRGAVQTGLEAIALAERAAQPRAELLSRMLVAWVEGVLCDHGEPAERQIELGLRLVRALGATRFEAQNLGVRALLALRRGDRKRAREIVSDAMQVGRAGAAWSHIAPSILGICALIETEPDTRRQLLAEGESHLASGSPSHNHIALRGFAIDVALEAGDWAAVDLNCERLRAYTAEEPLPLCDFLMARGAALVRHGRGERTPALRDTLIALRQVALDAELHPARTGIDVALEAFDGA